MALIGAIYSLIVLYFALNRIFFPANEEALQRLIACLKKPIKLQENEKQLLQFSTSQLTYGSTQHLYRLKNAVFCDFKMDGNKVVIERRVVQFWSEMKLVISSQFKPV